MYARSMQKRDFFHAHEKAKVGSGVGVGVGVEALRELKPFVSEDAPETRVDKESVSLAQSHPEEDVSEMVEQYGQEHSVEVVDESLAELIKSHPQRRQ